MTIVTCNHVDLHGEVSVVSLELPTCKEAFWRSYVRKCQQLMSGPSEQYWVLSDGKVAGYGKGLPRGQVVMDRFTFEYAIGLVSGSSGGEQHA